MAYTDKAEFKIPRHFVNKGGINIETISANKTLTYKDSMYQILTNSKGAVATVKVPVKKDGAMFWIKCQTGSGHELYIQDIDGNDIIGSPYLGAGKLCCLVCDGSSWGILFQQG